MKDEEKTKKQLIDELREMRRRIADLEESEIEPQYTEETLRNRLKVLEESVAGEMAGDADRAFSTVHGLLSALSDRALLLDTDGNIVSLNQTAAEAFGKSTHELIGLNAFDLFPAPLAETRRMYHDQVVHSGRPSRYQDKPKDEWLDTTIYPVFDAQGKVVRVAVLSRDITKLKASEEERYRNILESIEEGYYEVDLSGKMTFFNDSQSRILGYPEDELLGMNNRAFMDKEVSKKVYETFNKVYKRGKPEKAFDWKIIRKDGIERWIEASISLMKNTAGEAVGFRGVCRDVTERKVAEEELARHRDHLEQLVDERTRQLTESNLRLSEEIAERKQAEEALRESEAKYRDLVQNANSIILRFDGEGRINFLNEFAQSFFGYPEDEILGHNVLGTIVPRTDTSGHDLAAMFRDLLQHPEQYINNENENMRRNGERVWVAWANKAVLDDDGRIVEILAIGNDITERKRAEEELRDSEKRFRTVIDASKDAMIAINREGLITVFNPAAEHTFGRKKGELIGQPLDCLMPEEYRERHREYVKGYFTRGEPHDAIGRTVELPALRSDGNVFPVELSLSVGQRGNEQFVLAVIRDITERKEAEKALHDERNRAQKYLDIAGVMFVAINRKGEVTLINRKGCEVLGYDEEEIVGKNWFDNFIPEKLRDEIKPISKKLLVGELEAAEYYENPILTKHGEERIVAWHNTILKDEKGKIIGHLSSGEDITDRKQAEEALRESEAKYRELFSTESDAIMILDVDSYRFTDANDATLRLYGYSRDEFLRLKPTDVSAEPEKSKVAINDTIAGKIHQIPLRYHKKKDGTVFPVEISFGNFMLKNRKMICAVIRDISARKRAEEALRESEGRIRSIMASAPDPMVVYNTEGKVTYLNPAFTQVFGWTLEELSSQKIDYVPEKCWPETQMMIEKIKRGENVYGFETRRLTKSGEMLDISISAAILRDGEGNLLGNVTTLRDITERKRGEEELQKTKEAAEAANRAKSTFLANMSHEVRTPLNAIIGYSEMLMEDAKDQGQEGFIPDLERIHASGRHLLVLINDILDLSKIEAGKMDLYLETFGVSSMIEDVVDTIQPMADKNANTLKVRCPDDLGNMHADLTKVRQVLYNLLSNACKFTEQGTISLDVARERVNDLDWFTFRVSDTGMGMTSEQMGKLFQVFSQVHAPTGHSYGGTGLGLVISKRFCKMMDGEITAESEYGVGSTFTVRLPAESKVPEAKPVTPGEPRAEPVPEGASTVLVIDDDPTVRDLMERFLSKEGLRVETASGGEEGLKRAKELHPDAITLDVIMPGMDGWAMLSALKADPQVADIPVIMLTIVDDKNMGYTLGASDYLTKPIDRDRLVAILQKYRSDLFGCPVLVVEDDTETRHRLRRTLEKDGCVVTEAENGRVALQRVVDTQPAVILLDLMMPEMDGFEFVAELRKHESWRSIPVVVITAKDITGEDRLRLNGCIEKILEKGAYSREELLGEVRDLVKACVRPEKVVRA